MKRATIAGIVAVVLAAVLASVPVRPQAPEARKRNTGGTKQRRIPCKTPENAATCYWTHGRLSFYILPPPLRIWKIGTERLLGVYGGPSGFPPQNQSQLFLPTLPANLERIYRDSKNWSPPEELIDAHVYWAESIFADFEVCPLAPLEKGAMQPVCIESARNIFIQKEEATDTR